MRNKAFALFSFSINQIKQAEKEKPQRRGWTADFFSWKVYKASDVTANDCGKKNKKKNWAVKASRCKLKKTIYLLTYLFFFVTTRTSGVW